MSRRAEVLTAVCGIIIVAAVLIATQPRDVFWGADNGNRLIQLQTFVRTHGIAVDPGLRGIHFIRVGARTYSIYSPVFAILCAPLYALLGFPGLFVPSIVGTIALVCMMPALSKGSVLLTAIVLLFATPLFWYTLVFWEHTLFVALAVGAFILAERGMPGLAGLLAGCATLLREEGYVLIASIAVACIVTRRPAREALWLAAAASAVLLPWWAVNFAVFGHPFGIHALFYQLIAHGSKVANVFPYLFEFSSRSPHATLLILPWVALIISSPFRIAPWLRAALFALVAAASAGLTFLMLRSAVPIRETLYTQGLFTAVPFSATIFLNVPELWRQQRFRFVTVLCGIVLTTVVVTQDFGVIWGPRYYLWIVPLMLVLGFHALGTFLRDDGLPQMIVVIAATAFLAISFCIQFTGVRILRMKLSFSERLLSAVSNDPARIVVTDVFWLPEELAAIPSEKRIVLVLNDAEFLRGVTTTSSPFLFVASNSTRRISNEAIRPMLRRVSRRRRITVADMDVMLLNVDSPGRNGTRNGPAGAR